LNRNEQLPVAVMGQQSLGSWSQAILAASHAHAEGMRTDSTFEAHTASCIVAGEAYTAACIVPGSYMIQTLPFKCLLKNVDRLISNTPGLDRYRAIPGAFPQDFARLALEIA
jgi:hypothetical protein